jgi:hypothetical protein
VGFSVGATQRRLVMQSKESASHARGSGTVKVQATNPWPRVPVSRPPFILNVSA